VTHLNVRHNNLQSWKVVVRILEGRAILGTWIHKVCECLGFDAGSEVDKIACIYLRGVDLNDRPVLGIALVTDANTDGGRQNDMA
jgi:hypothetical protein